MTKLTKEQAVVVSGYTGFLICDFSDLHAEIEKRFRRPVFTHELGDDEMFKQVQAKFKLDFLEMAP